MTPDATGRSALEQLPNEIKSAIFAALPDAQSLLSVVLAGHELYTPFKSDECSIVRQVLGRQVHESVLGDAVMVWEAQRADHKGWDRQQIDRLFESHHHLTDAFVQTCDLARALELVRFHNIVQDFSGHLAGQALHSASKRYAKGGAALAASQDEIIRIERAFYRFELYCVLFGNTKERLIDPGRKQREAFWDRYAPWEIEQVACVYEYLRGEVRTAFEKLALTIPVWMEYASITGSFTDASDEFLQAQMTRGLNHIVRILAACDATPRNCNLQLPDSRNEQVFDLYSIEESLNWSIDLGDPPEYLTLQEMDTESEQTSQIIKSSFCVDPDTGPETAWRWAHRDVSPDFSKRSGFVLNESQMPLRECGYVSWDRQRLESWQLMREPWEAPDPFEIEDERDRKVKEFGQRLHFRTEQLIHQGILRRGLWL